MTDFIRSILSILLFIFIASYSYGQVDDEFSSALDSARALEDNKKDSIVFSSRFVRYATLDMLKHATYTQQIDTTHRNFQYYNPQNRPANPSVHLGSYGLATRDLLFNPSKSIGFEPGFHSLERLLLTSDSVRYYRARARYSELYAVGFFFDDQIFRAKLAQNINPRWSVGAEYHASNTDGFYANQAYSDRKGSVATWYESENRRYNLLINGTFNKLDATENGSITNDTTSIFDGEVPNPFSVQTKLRGQQQNRPFNKWLDNGLFVRQSFFIGRLDTVHAGLPEMEIHPTNSFAHNTSIRQRKYIFFKNEEDIFGAFPIGDAVRVEDTTKITTISNEFTYAFYLRSSSMLKNEAKVNVGFQNDLIWYSDSLTSEFMQNSAVKGDIRYQLSDKVLLNASANQIVVGSHFGDYLYEANVGIGLGDNIGRITLGAYTQNRSPEMVFSRMNYTYHQWERDDLEKTKTQNLSFRYQNKRLGFTGKAEYFLVNNHHYFREIDNPTQNERLDRVIEPAQLSSLNMLKLSVGQNFKFGNFHLDNLVVYQKSDAMDVLSTPELYTWHSFYFKDIWYNVLDFSIGLDGRFNTPFRASSYAINAGQFYHSNVDIEFSSYPIVDAWITANIQRVNIFLSYNFLNQHLYPKGYYTVRRYPMNPANLRFGVSWQFYD